MKYAVDIGGDILVWKDGEFESESEELLEYIEESISEIEDAPYMTISLDGSTLYSGKGIDPTPSWSASFGFLQELTGGDMEFVAGNRPDWGAMGYEIEDGQVS